MIYSDLDFASSGSWASYPDMGTDTLWEINDASSSACATSTSAPHLRRLDAWMQGNMQDGSWGSPGYRTIFSFLDDDGRLIASFGNVAQMSIEDISLPGLKYIRFRQWGSNSGPGFLIDLYCKSVSVLVFNSLLSTFTSVATAQVSNALPASFTCADDPSAQVLLTFTNVSQYQQGTAALGALVQDIRSRLVGATLVYDTSSGSFLSAGQPATAVSGIPSPGGAPVSQVIFSESTSSPFTSLEITHRCVYLHRPCAVEATSSLLGSQRAATSSCATNNNRQPLKLPALFLSDADGPYGTSYASYPDISDVTEWSSDIAGSVSCTAGTQPMLAELNMSMIPNMADGNWGSPGYRTILSFIGNSSSTNATSNRSLLLSLGNRQQEQLETIRLPSLSAVRLRVWYGQSGQGYSFEVRCRSTSPPILSVEMFTGTFERQTIVAASNRSWVGSVTCPTFSDASPSGTVVSNVEFDLSNNPQSTLDKLVGLSLRRTATATTRVALTFVNATWYLGGSSNPADVGWPSYLVYSGAFNNIASIVTDIGLSVNLTVVFRCVFVHRPFVSPATATATITAEQGPLRYPSVILSDVDGPLGSSWTSYADHASSSSWSSSLAGPLTNATTTTTTTTVPRYFGCNASAGEYPELTYMNISVMPSMQDGSWNSPGYRTLISFLNSDGDILVAFGNNATQVVANLSLPTLQTIRVQLIYQQSAPGYIMHLQCRSRKSTCAQPAASYRITGRTTYNLLPLPAGSCVRFSCAQRAGLRPSAVIGPPLGGFAIDDLVVGATMFAGQYAKGYSSTIDSSLDFVFGSYWAATPSTNLSIFATCIYAYPGCSAVTPNKRNIHLPAAILSDADGRGITSWYPYPTTQSDCTYTFAPHSPSPFFSTFAGEGAAVVPPQSGRVKFVAASFALRPLASPLGYNIAAYPVTVAHNITMFVNSIPSSIDTTSMLASTYVDAIQLTRMGTYLSDAGYVLHLDGFPATVTSSVTEEISRSRSYGSQTPTPSMSLSQRTMSASNTSTPTVSRTPWTLTVAITPTIPRTSPSTTLSSSRTKTASESSSKSISSTRESMSKSSTATGDCPQRSLKLFDILFGSVVLSTGIELRNATSANNNNTNLNTSVPVVAGGLLSAQTGDNLRGDSLFQCSLCSQQLFLRNLSSTTSVCNGSRLMVNTSTTNSPQADDSTILSSVMLAPSSQYVMFGPSGSEASIVVDRTEMLKQHAASSSSSPSMTSVLTLRALFSFEYFTSLSARATTSTSSSLSATESGVTIHSIVRGVEVAVSGVTVVPATTTTTVSESGNCRSSSDVESRSGGDTTITDPSRYSCCQFADAGARTQRQWLPLHIQMDPSTLSALTWSDSYALRVRVPLALVDCGVANTVPLPRNSTRDFTMTTATTFSGNTTTSITTAANAFTIDIRFIASVPAKDISGIVSVGTVGSVAATSAALSAFTGSPTFAITTARVATLRALMACSFNGQVDSSGDASAIISNAVSSGINVTSWLVSTYSLKLSNAIELAQLDSILNWDIGAGGATTTPNHDNVNGLDQQLVIAYGNTIRGGVIGNMVLLLGFLATYIVATMVVLFGMVWKRFHDGQQHHRPFVIAFRTVFLENPLDVLYQWSGAVHAAGVFCLPLSVLLIPTVQLLVKQFWELTAPAVDGVVAVVTLLVLVGLLVKWLYTLLPLRGESREKENNNSSSSGILDGPFACKVVRYSLVDRTMLWDRFNLSWDRVVYSLRHCARRPADDVTVNDDEGDVGIQRYEKAKPLYSLPEAPSTLLQFFRSSLRGATYFAFCPQQHWIAIRAVAVVEPGAGEDHHAEGTKASPTNPAPLKHHHGAQVVGARLVAAGGGSSVTTTHRRIWKRQHLFCFSEFRILAVIRWELFMSIVIALANGIVQSYLLHHNDTSSSSLCLIPIIILVINYAVSIAVYFILWPSFVPAVNALTLSTNICGLAAGVAAVLAVQYTNNVSVSSNAADVTMMALLLISCVGYIRSAMDLMSVFTGVMHAWGTLSRLADLLISRAVSRQLTAGGGGNSSSVETPLALNVVDLCQLDDGGVQLVSSDDDGDNETGDDDDDHDKSLDGTPTQLNGSFLTFSPLSPGGLHREDSTGAAGSTSNSFIGIPHSDVTGVGNKSLVSANDLERAYKKGGQQLPATAAALLQQRNAASKGGQRESTKQSQRAENRMSPRAASMEDSLQRSQLSVNGSFAFRLDVDDDDL